MPMFRFSGGTNTWDSALLTTVSPSRIFPSVGRSKPAIIRRVVDFPQPEGPRKEMNSPSATSRLKSPTAVTLPNRLYRCSNLT